MNPIAILISKFIPFNAPSPPIKLLSPPPCNRPARAPNGEEPAALDPEEDPAAVEAFAASVTGGCIALSNPSIISLRTDPTTSPITSSVEHIGVGE